MKDLNLVGSWMIDEANPQAIDQYGVLVEFTEGGDLTYTIRGSDSDHIIKIRYRKAMCS